MRWRAIAGSHYARAWWLWLAAIFALAYAALTPPFQAPDEVGHFWRSYALARGSVLPDMSSGSPSAQVPRGVRDLVATLWVETGGKSGDEAKVGLDRLRAAARVPLGSDELVRVAFPAFYTPVPYLPQSLACIIGDRTGLRPLTTFYLGRLFNAAFALFLIAVAVRLARDPSIFIAIALLPMLLYLCGSYSADPVTVGLAFVTTAVALEPERSPRTWWGLLVCAFLLALCKPVYFLVAFAGIFRIRERRLVRVSALVLVVAAGMLLSSANTRRNFFAMRTDVPISLTQQTEHVRAAPLQFLEVAANEYASGWLAYLDHFVGRLGWLDVPLPRPLVILMLALLLLTGISSAPMKIRDRALSVAIILVSLLVVALSQYVAWTPIGADRIDGMQGRYFLPLGPLALLSLGVMRGTKVRIAIGVAVAVTAIALNAIALYEIVQRYY